jgi:hypothetical protein
MSGRRTGVRSGCWPPNLDVLCVNKVVSTKVVSTVIAGLLSGIATLSIKRRVSHLTAARPALVGICPRPESWPFVRLELLTGRPYAQRAARHSDSDLSPGWVQRRQVGG